MNKDIAVIFDFNGTCIFDGKYHDEAWKTYVNELASREVSDKEIKEHILGKTAKDILEHFLGYELSFNMVNQFSEEKERIYRSLLMKAGVDLVPGLEEFLNFLRLAQIKRTIATTANLENMNMYFERYNLGEWFRWEDVVIGMGNIPLKPHPDLYLAAMNKLEMTPEKVVVFEDSETGVRAAEAAGIRHIIVITGDSKRDDLINHRGVIACVEDFTHLGEIDLDL